MLIGGEFFSQIVKTNYLTIMFLEPSFEDSKSSSQKTLEERVKDAMISVLQEIPTVRDVFQGIVDPHREHTRNINPQKRIARAVAHVDIGV